MSGKRTEALQLRLTPETWDRCAQRASSLGLSVALWAERTLARAAVGPMPAAMSPEAAQAFLARLLPTLNEPDD